jgi:hypothetical protein
LKLTLPPASSITLDREPEGRLVVTHQKLNSVRRHFFSSLRDGVRVTWPILSGLLMCQVGLGMAIGVIERWGIWKGVYFALITGLTIGYGDLVPRQSLTQALAIAIGFFGIALTGIVAALAVRALQATADAQHTERMAAYDVGNRARDL